MSEFEKLLDETLNIIQGPESAFMLEMIAQPHRYYGLFTVDCAVPGSIALQIRSIKDLGDDRFEIYGTIARINGIKATCWPECCVTYNPEIKTENTSGFLKFMSDNRDSRVRFIKSLKGWIEG